MPLGNGIYSNTIWVFSDQFNQAIKFGLGRDARHGLCSLAAVRQYRDK